MESYKKRWGDKRDARLVRKNELDTNHFVMPLLWPKRTDSEAFISETLDLTNAIDFLSKKMMRRTMTSFIQHSC